KVTLFNAAPAVIAAVLDAAAARRQQGVDVPGRGRMRVVIAGAPPPSKTIERIEAELGWEFIRIYGLTETSPLLTINRAPAGRVGWRGRRGAGPPALTGRGAGGRRADAGGRRGRGPRPVQPRLRGVLEPARGDGQGHRGRLVSHRGWWLRGRGLHRHLRSQE